jgi:hypothetical protein
MRVILAKQSGNGLTTIQGGYDFMSGAERLHALNLGHKLCLVKSYLGCAR